MGYMDQSFSGWLRLEPSCTTILSGTRARRGRQPPLDQLRPGWSQVWRPRPSSPQAVGHCSARPLKVRKSDGEGTFVGVRGNDEVAPIADRGGLKRGRQQSTPCRHLHRLSAPPNLLNRRKQAVGAKLLAMNRVTERLQKSRMFLPRD
jgi:hypothetical protein